MSTPGSDDSLLAEPAPYMPVSPHAKDYMLRSERADWEKRASVAADVATELDAALTELSSVTFNNHFGECTEGQAVFKGLINAVSLLTRQLSSHSNAAHTLSISCGQAGATFEQADAAGAKTIEA